MNEWVNDGRAHGRREIERAKYRPPGRTCGREGGAALIHSFAHSLIHPLTTPEHYDLLLARCRALFLAKTHDYGTAWRILRLPSVTDQIFIKANRIRTIQETGVQLVADDVNEEFVAIINYCLIALMQLHLPPDTPLDMTPEAVAAAYDAEAAENRRLLLAKNHDYGEAWRQMRVASITDLILMKLHRVKQLEDIGGDAWVSESVEGSYRDMLNYAVFALILRGEK
ncbi:DUF1599 domain-containing protein [Hymenobacter sp. BT189]|uniref:DUF1599 domain-containing protein n=1 Tax=Hymenobacter armeniacus TaxID=2771358 RepID=A0ABR8JVM4_9BACT|nr:DUF1599 domain-containing protein [Hymenobacter armeniacus]